MNNITRRLMILLMILCLVSVGYTPSASAVRINHDIAAMNTY